MTIHLTLVEVLAIHEDQIRRFGGEPGVRDFGLIEAALFRPQTGYYDDLIQQAAALWESMSQNHPFVDGNKRTAFAATDVFLRVNGLFIVADPVQTHEQIVAWLETGRFTFLELDAWLRRHTSDIRGKR